MEKRMVKIDLITGFLGSGKTTFLKQYAQYLLRQGQNIGILENDFGAVNVDMMLLQDLEGEKCELEMISGGCDAETHRRRFRTKLIAMGMCGYDRVLVEPSGIYDVDEFFDVLRDEPLDQWYEIGSVIAIVDAGLDPELSDEANYLLASEAANAGSIVLSHADEVSTEQIEETITHLNAALKQAKCSRQVGEEVLRKSGAQLTDADFEQILKNGYRTENYQKMDLAEGGFQSVYLLDQKLDRDKIQNIIQKIFETSECGKIFRIKGFVQENGQWYEVNGTRHETKIDAIGAGQDVAIVIGEKLDEGKIQSIFAKK